MKKLSLYIAPITLVLSQPLAADSLPLNPGLWESTVTTTSPYTGTQTRTMKECVTEQDFDPVKMMGDAEGCEVTHNELKGDTLNFTMQCDMEGGQGEVNGEYQTDGETGSGSMTMIMTFGGQTMEMEHSFTAQRIGDC